MKDYTSNSPVFSDIIQIVAFGDIAHPDILNPASIQLLQNTLVLRDAFISLISEEDIKAYFLQNFTKVDLAESDTLSQDEIEEAVSYPYNGEASEDDEALQPEEINESVNSEWHGEGSEDGTALSPDEILEACR